MVRPAIIAGMVPGIDESIQDTLVRIADAGYEGVELGLTEEAPESVAGAVEATDLEVTSVMTGLHHVRTPTDELVDACRAFDCDRVVLGYLDESYFDSPATTRETATLLNECAAGLDEFGLELCYHNHDHEFERFDGRTAFDVLIEHLDERVSIEFDVGWVGAGGESPAGILEAFGDRASLVHLKDMIYETATPVELGAGDLDVGRVVDAADEQGIEWLVYEDEGDSDQLEKLHHGAAQLRELLADGPVQGGDER